MSSAVKTRVKGMMKGAGRIFGTVKKKAADNEGVPVFEIQTTTSSILSPPDRERADSIDEELLPPTPQLYTPNRESRIPGEEVVVEEVRKIDVAKDRELPMNESPIYSDDNDGKKDRLCAPCEGCIVL